MGEDKIRFYNVLPRRMVEEMVLCACDMILNMINEKQILVVGG